MTLYGFGTIQTPKRTQDWPDGPRGGSDLCYWVINAEGNILARTTVQHVTDLDRKQPESAERIKTFDEALNTRFRDPTHELPDVVSGSSFFLEDIAEDGEPAPDEPAYADGEEGAFSQVDFTPDSFDT